MIAINGPVFEGSFDNIVPFESNLTGKTWVVSCSKMALLNRRITYTIPPLQFLDYSIPGTPMDRATSSTTSRRHSMFRSRYFFAAVIPLIVTTVAFGYYQWKSNFKNRVLLKRFGVVEEGKIYRSGQISKKYIEETLQDYDIQAIIDLNGYEHFNKDQEHELAVAWKLKIPVNRFSLAGDGTGDIHLYAQALTALRDYLELKKPVLIHCAAGSQRTGSTVAFYRLLVQRKSPAVVMDEMLNYNWQRGTDFVSFRYINDNMGKMAELLLQTNVIDDIPDPLPQLKLR